MKPGDVVNDYDKLLKVVLVGDSDSHKSDLLAHFDSSTTNTIGVDFRVQTFEHNGERIKLQVWDTAGQEKFRAITNSYYRGAHIVGLAFDITNKKTFASLNQWCEEASSNGPGAHRIVFGINAQNNSARQVSVEEVEAWAKSKDLTFVAVDTSSKADVERAFMIAMQERLARSFNSAPSAPWPKGEVVTKQSEYADAVVTRHYDAHGAVVSVTPPQSSGANEIAAIEKQIEVLQARLEILRAENEQPSLAKK